MKAIRTPETPSLTFLVPWVEILEIRDWKVVVTTEPIATCQARSWRQGPTFDVIAVAQAFLYPLT